MEAERARDTGGARKAAAIGREFGCNGTWGGGSQKTVWRGWRAPAAEVVVVGLLATMALLVLAFGAGGGLLPSALQGVQFVRKPGKQQQSYSFVYEATVELALTKPWCKCGRNLEPLYRDCSRRGTITRACGD